MAKLIAFFLLICSWICKTSASARKNAWNYTMITKNISFSVWHSSIHIGGDRASEVKVGRHDPRTPNPHSALTPFIFWCIIWSYFSYGPGWKNKWPPPTRTHTILGQPPFQSVMVMTSKNWSVWYKMTDIHPRALWPLQMMTYQRILYLDPCQLVSSLKEKFKSFSSEANIFYQWLCVCAWSPASDGRLWLKQASRLLLVWRRLDPATIGPDSLPPLAEHLPPSRISWYQFIRRHCCCEAGGPLCWRSGPRMGTGPGPGPPAIAQSLRRVQHNSPHIHRYQTIPDDRQLDVSTGVRKRDVITQRATAGVVGTTVICPQPSWPAGGGCLKQESGDGEHAVPRSSERAHGEFQSWKNKHKTVIFSFCTMPASLTAVFSFL